MASLKVGTSPTNIVDIPIEPDDLVWGLQDISASDSGRVMDHAVTMYKNRIAQKRKISLAWTNPSLADTSTILKMFNPEYVHVRFLDPMENSYMTREFYVGDRSAPYRQITLDNHDGTKTTMRTLSFDIVER